MYVLEIAPGLLYQILRLNNSGVSILFGNLMRTKSLYMPTNVPGSLTIALVIDSVHRTKKPVESIEAGGILLSSKLF